SEGETVSLLRKWGISGARYGVKKLGIPGLIVGGLIGGVVGKFMGSENKSTTKGETESRNETVGDSKQTSESRAKSTSDTKGSTSTIGESETFSFETNDKRVERMIAKVDQQLKRIDESRSYGFWNASFYVLGDTSESAHTACSLFEGILKGKDSTIEDSAITIWNNQDVVRRSNALKYFENITHPKFILANPDPNNPDQTIVTPSSLLSGKELALLMNFPRKSVSGTLVLEMPAFGRNVVYHSNTPEQADMIRLGCVYHYGQELKDSEVRLSLKSLAMHTFISGSTGSGKTNSVYQIIKEIRHYKKKFLIIEPAKGEYKDSLGGYPDVHVFGTNPAHAPLLKLNPFEFPDNIHVLEHIDRLVEIFSACWPMYAAMPAVLKSGIEDAYRQCGWNL
ncbi:MAG: helicase HerA domain-containing protein, partial [Candidatus Cloacimonadaceae bacterium]